MLCLRVLALIIDVGHVHHYFTHSCRRYTHIDYHLTFLLHGYGGNCLYPITCVSGEFEYSVAPTYEDESIWSMTRVPDKRRKCPNPH